MSLSHRQPLEHAPTCLAASDVGPWCELYGCRSRIGEGVRPCRCHARPRSDSPRQHLQHSSESPPSTVASSPTSCVRRSHPFPHGWHREGGFVGHPWHWTLSDRNHTRPQAYYSKHLPLRRSSLDRGMVLIVEIKGRIAQEGSSADMCDGG